MVMGVQLASSGEEAVVSVCVDGALEDQGKVLDAVARDRGAFRTRLARRLALRRASRPTFVLDVAQQASRPEGLSGRRWDA